MIMIELKECPFCHSDARIVETPLWGENGRGYYGCYDYAVECSNIHCNVHPKTKSMNTIYHKKDECIKTVIDWWNNR